MRGGALAMIEAVHLVLGGWHDVTFKWVVVTTFRCQMWLVYLLFVFAHLSRCLFRLFRLLARLTLDNP